MNSKGKSLRSPLGRVRGLGSAKNGSEHWWLQRLTSLALIPLSIYPVAMFFIYAVFGGYEGAHTWVKSLYAATALILFLAVGFHHAASGLQVVIEDYVHGETPKLFAVILVKFIAAAFAILGILAVLKILLGA
jgi:succinate dehydrogenase / fumarate reductase membrane anchor subunit